MRRIGVGYRQEIAPWIFAAKSEIELVELTAEHFFYGRNLKELKKLKNQYPLCLHGLSLSIGTPGNLSANRLREFKNIVDIANPLWISEHISFTRTAHVDLGHLTPIKYTEAQLDICVDHAKELMSVCQKPLLLENITSMIKIDHEIDEPVFLNELCERSGCGLLLDVTNLYVNSVNLEFDPYSWLKKLNPHYVQQLHVVGFSSSHGLLMDSHAESIEASPELLQLISYVSRNFSPMGIIVERDEHFPQSKNLTSELTRLQQIWSENAVY